MSRASSILRLVVGCTLLIAFSISGYAQQPGPAKVPGATSDELHLLWTENVSPILKGPIPSTSQAAYYAGEMLLVPLHAAFLRKDAGWEQEFSDHFQRLMQSRSSLTDVDLSRLQYLYLASEFVVLASQSGKANLVPTGLPDFLYSETQNLWRQKPAWQWDHPAFNGGIRERVLWKLNTRNVAKSYYRAILDVEFFVFAIAADLRAYGFGQQPDRRALLDDVLSIAGRVCRQEIKPTDSGGWVLQPGVMTDHPDFKFAGHSNPGPGMVPVSVRGISWDSSHSLRFPAWVASLMNAYSPGSTERRFYTSLRDGLNTQFFSKVLTPPSADSPCYRTNNYMDGGNGLYRWNYKNIGEGGGYAAYKTSGALLIGWWGLLDTDQSRSLYRKLADQFPWPQQCVYLYLGPVAPGHERPKSETDPSSPAMKFRYMIARLASEV